jgi:hypothetical protein
MFSYTMCAYIAVKFNINIILFYVFIFDVCLYGIKVLHTYSLLCVRTWTDSIYIERAFTFDITVLSW